MKQLFLCAAVAAVLPLVAAAPSALAQSHPYTSVPLAMSGALFYLNSSVSTGSPIKKSTFNAQSLIKLLNASPRASNSVFQVTGKTRIPARSYFLWNLSQGTLTITNKDGFSFPLQNVTPVGAYDYGKLQLDEFQLVGNDRLDAGTSAGTETDVTGILFRFYDGQSYENEIGLYGIATLHWSYGPAKGGLQNAALSVTMTGCGNDGSNVDGFPAVSTMFSASGAASAVESTADNVPFIDTF